MDWRSIKFFKPKEFESPDLKGSSARMDFDLVYMLDCLREEIGKPLIINSAFRTESHNRKIGGVKNSSHLKGLAVDVSCTSAVTRYQIVNIATDMGFNGIGIYKNFIHLDIDKNKGNRLWIDSSKNLLSVLSLKSRNVCNE